MCQQGWLFCRLAQVGCRSCFRMGTMISPLDLLIQSHGLAELAIVFRVVKHCGPFRGGASVEFVMR